MVRRVTQSQLRNLQRQAESKRRQWVNRYNQGVRNYKRAVEDYNRQVRAYNSRQRSSEQRLRSELNKLSRHRSTQYASFRVSVSRLSTSYTKLDQSVISRSLTPEENFFFDLSERETANGVGVLNALLEPGGGDAEGALLQQTSITDEIAAISEELNTRWHGALFSLNPQNPEASRHFCTSAREIFTDILDIRAPDIAVETHLPNCQRTDLGTPTRRSKIQYLLESKEVHNNDLVEFVEVDIQNIIDLFDVFNAATHGKVGTYDLVALAAIKKRVEDGLIFLARIAV